MLAAHMLRNGICATVKDLFFEGLPNAREQLHRLFGKNCEVIEVYSLLYGDIGVGSQAVSKGRKVEGRAGWVQLLRLSHLWLRRILS